MIYSYNNKRPVLDSPSVLAELDYDLNKQTPLRFYPDLLGRFKAYAITCLLLSAGLVVLILGFDLSRFWLLLILPLVFMAHRFMQKTYNLKPLLTVYPDKGIISPRWLSGVGWSLLDDIRFHERLLGKTEVELVFRPGMPWPGVRGDKTEPKDHPKRGRVLLVDVSTMSASMQKQMYKTIIKHYMDYRVKRGWAISPGMV